FTAPHRAASPPHTHFVSGTRPAVRVPDTKRVCGRAAARAGSGTGGHPARAGGGAGGHPARAGSGAGGRRRLRAGTPMAPNPAGSAPSASDLRSVLAVAVRSAGADVVVALLLVGEAVDDGFLSLLRQGVQLLHDAVAAAFFRHPLATVGGADLRLHRRQLEQRLALAATLSGLLVGVLLLRHADGAFAAAVEELGD